MPKAFHPKRGGNPRNRKAANPAADDMEKREISATISKTLDVPRSALPGIVQMELSGNREAVIDGCQGVLEYDETVIKLTTGKMAIQFTGRNLQIKVLTHDSAIVEGFITNIEFIT